MSKSLGYFVSGSPAIDALAQKYGQQLQELGLDEKLLAIRAITGALLTDPCSSSSLTNRIEAHVCVLRVEGYEVDNGLQEALTALDSCNQAEWFALLTALVAYANEEFRQFGS